MALLFEWDSRKADRNFHIHDVSFDEACTAFQDPFSRTIDDPLHSEKENRFVLIGYSYRNKLLVVVHTDRGDRIRIISARSANRKEKREHETNKK